MNKDEILKAVELIDKDQILKITPLDKEIVDAISTLQTAGVQYATLLQNNRLANMWRKYEGLSEEDKYCIDKYIDFLIWRRERDASEDSPT